MSTLEPSPNALAEAVLSRVDPRLVEASREEFIRALEVVRASRKSKVEGRIPLPAVLVGHRAAGKTTLLPLLAKFLGVAGVDLDQEIALRTGRSVSAWVKDDVSGFRQMEREVFGQIPASCVVAVGGGFLSLHTDLLEGCTAVLVPVSFDTYRERLLADSTRPRLRPELSMEEEIRQVFEEREVVHGKTRTVPLPTFLAEVLAPGDAS